MHPTETWHLSRGYTQDWAIYCNQPYQRDIDFQTFSTENVNCTRCYDIAVKARGQAKADKRTWGIS